MSLIPFTTYKLCVVCMTYNHAPYIEDALKGFAIQKTNFPFMILACDDASTDGEQEVINHYINENLDKSSIQIEETDDAIIIAGIHKDNPNCHFVFELLKYNFYSLKKAKTLMVNDWYKDTPYRAICEGDDYWTNPNKLQKQVDYLDTHPECGLVYGKAKCYYQDEGKFKGTTGHYMSGYYDMFVNYSIAPMTTMYRTTAVEGYSEFVKGQSWLMGDSPLFLYIAHNHDIYFMDEVVGVYRVLKNSASHHTSYDDMVRFKNSTFAVVKFFCEKYGHPNFKQLESIHYSYLFNYAFNDSRYDTAKEVYKQIPYPNLKIKIKRIILSSRILRNVYHYLYHKYAQ